MTQYYQGMSPVRSNSLQVSAVLRKTYLLLGSSMLFSAICAYYSMQHNFAPNFLIVLIGMFGLSQLAIATSKTKFGLPATFLFTGFMGFILGPTLNFYIKGFSNGPQLVGSALATTAILLFSLSFYTIVNRKNYNYMGGFLFAASIVAVIGALALMFFHVPMLQVLVSGAFAVISCGYILFTTSELINGGETSAVRATIMLFISIFNLFISLLNILSFFAGNRR